MRYFIHLSFKGTRYHGWQIQQNAPSVQAVLEHALFLFLGETVSVTGCGRTDTGVHAKDFWAHFDYTGNVFERGSVEYKINAILPPDIIIHRIFPVSGDCHARFGATSRCYRYFIRLQKDPFLDDLTAAPGTYSPMPLNVEAMNRASEFLTGTHDFTSFSKLHSQTGTNICTVSAAGWHTSCPEFASASLLFFEVTADRFLRNMVRCMVGTLLEVGRGKKPVEWILQVLQEKNRSMAGHSVPAEGLFLWKVNYENLKTID